jgi:hypothetical protein
MNEAIYHALGICGEHSHPNLLNVSLIVLIGYVIIKSRRKIKA